MMGPEMKLSCFRLDLKNTNNLIEPTMLSQIRSASMKISYMIVKMSRGAQDDVTFSSWQGHKTRIIDRRTASAAGVVKERGTWGYKSFCTHRSAASIRVSDKNNCPVGETQEKRESSSCLLLRDILGMY